MAVTRRKSAAALPQADAPTPTATPTPSKTAAKSKSKSKSKGKSTPAATPTATANGHALKTVQHSKNKSSNSKSKSHIHWHSLADTHITAHQQPLFTPDGQYYFQPTAHAIRILSRHTGATISTLTPPPLPHALSDDTIPAASHAITALALHPANPLQLLSASTNGSICVWDYLDAALLRIFFLPIPSSSPSAEGERATTKSSEDAAVPGMPITHLVASEHYPDWAFVCARRPKRSSSSSSSPTTYSTIIYALRLSLARSPSSSTDPSSSDEPITHITASAGGGKERSVPVYIPRTQSRLGKIKLIPAALRLCPRAEHLIVAGGTQIYVASLQRTRAEGSQGEGMLVDGGALDEELIACPDGLAKFTTSNTLTALAVHPTEKSIATGDITGKIRIFHGLLEDDFLARRRSASDDADDEANPSSKKDKEKEKKGSSSSSFFGAPSTLLHWHAHAVSTLAYLPLAATGARLLSGGEEATLVLWHVQSAGSGRVQKEFVPRLGAAIASVGLAGSSSSGSGEEEEIVCGLMDGSVIFLNPASLKVGRTFARLKVDASRALFSRAQRSRMPAPLALQPTARGGPNVVLASGHPSTIQFYDPDEDGLVGELEVVGSNRVSRPDEAPIEPARVELVAFSPLLAAASSSSEEVAEWMATVDARRSSGSGGGGRGGRFASEICLKFWMWDVEEGRYGLATSIDRPHGDEGVVSALSFGFLGPSSSPLSALVGKKRGQTTSFENLVCVSTGSDGKVKSWRPVRVLGAEGLGVAKAKAKKAGKKAKKAASAAEVTYHWVARSVFTFRQTVPHAVAWAPSPVPSSSANGAGGLVAVAQGAFVTLWSLQPASNALVLALCAPELVSASASIRSSHEGGGEQQLTEGAREVAFVGRAGRFVVGASKEVVVCWDLLSGAVVWTRSYASPQRQQAVDEAASEKQHNSNKKSKKKSSRQQSNLRVVRIIPVPPGSAEGAEEMFGVLLVDELKRCSRIEIFDLGSGSGGGGGRTSSDGPTGGRVAAVGVLEIPFVVRSLVLAPAAHRSGSPGDGKGKSQSSKNKKLNAAIGAMGGYALSADFEPVQLGFPVGGGGGGAAAFQRGEGGEGAEANVIFRDGAEDVVRSRRVRTILDDLLGGGQAFLPEQLDALSLSNNRRGSLLLPGGGGGSGKAGGQMEDAFKLFEGPAHLLPPMSALFEAFSDAILPRRAVAVRPVGVETTAADEDGEGDGDESD